MKKNKSLHQRIAITFVKLSIGASLLFGLLAAITVEGIEEFLVDDRLASVATWALPRHAGKLPVEMPAGLVFYHGEEIPQFLRGLPDGVREVFVENNELHVLTGKDAGGVAYVVVDHASEYDKIELIMYSMILFALLVFIMLSLFLGRYVARRVVTPITTLAAAVREDHSQVALPLLDNDDEMGDLARAFAARTDELKRFLDRERFFTGDVSHELRTPLTVIIGAAEIIRECSQENPTLQAASERIMRTATEAAESITVLLLLARTPGLIGAPETGIAHTVHEEISHSQHLLDGKQVTLECVVDSDFWVFARRELLSAVIGNLIRNACLYTDKGSIRVRVNRPTVVIEDTGPGIPDFIRARLMNEPLPAEQIGSAGSGLGLSLVARICEHLGARIQVANRPMGGTTFTIDFSSNLTKT